MFKLCCYDGTVNTQNDVSMQKVYRQLYKAVSLPIIRLCML